MKLKLKKRKIGEIYLILFTPYVFENISGDCLHYILKNISQKRAISTEVFANVNNYFGPFATHSFTNSNCGTNSNFYSNILNTFS